MFLRCLDVGLAIEKDVVSVGDKQKIMIRVITAGEPVKYASMAKQLSTNRLQ